METKKFTAKATGPEVDIKMVVTVTAMAEHLNRLTSATKNFLFDSLRSQDFDVDKIEII